MKPTQKLASLISRHLKQGREVATFGAFIRQIRLERGRTQRDVARQIDMLPSNLCKLERDALKAPTDGEQLAALAKALEIKSGSAESEQFFELAARSNDSVPQDLVRIISRNEAVPLLLRAIGNRRLTATQVEALVRIIQGEAK